MDPPYLLCLFLLPIYLYLPLSAPLSLSIYIYYVESHTETDLGSRSRQTYVIRDLCYTRYIYVSIVMSLSQYLPIPGKQKSECRLLPNAYHRFAYCLYLSKLNSPWIHKARQNCTARIALTPVIGIVVKWLWRKMWDRLWNAPVSHQSTVRCRYNVVVFSTR